MNQLLLEVSESQPQFGVAIIPFIIFILVLVGVIWLQVVLSKKQNKWLGLILPFLCLFISVMGTLGTVAFSAISKTSVEEVNGEIIKMEVMELDSHRPDVGEIFVTAEVTPDSGAIVVAAAVTFVTMNIPTLILLAIYFACREGRKKNGELEKMNIQDLE